MQRIAAWVIVIVGFAVLNGVLYGGQYAYGEFRIRALESFKQGMDVRWAAFFKTRAEIEKLRSQLRQAEESLGRLRSTIAEIEAKYGEEGAPSDVYRHYQSLIEQHNTIVAESRSVLYTHNAAVQLFNSQVEAYNRDVDQHNRLLSKVPQSIWVMIPMPGRGSKSGRAPSPTIGPMVPSPVRP